MKCKSITIQGLFSTFDYKLSWNDESEEIMLLTGPNGYGKTTILKILYYLKEGQWYYFYKLPFREITIEFDNNSMVLIREENVLEQLDRQSDDVITPTRSIRFQWINSTNNEVSSQFVFSDRDAKKVEQSYPRRSIVRIEHDDERITLQEILDYIEQNEHIYDFLKEKQGYDAFNMFIEALNVFYIPANRLFRFDDEEKELSVKSISKQLKNRLRRQNYRYLNRVSEARSHVFENLLKGAAGYSRADYERIVSEYKERILKLHEWGLIPFKEFIPYQEGKGAIFYVYLNEIIDSLSQYEDLYRKLELFASLLRRKNFVNKRIEYSPTRGIIVTSLSGKPIDIDCLSSGEQNEIIMLYNFTFQLSQNMILLIDEPENSLHVEWQSVFYEELSEICKLNTIQAIVATHSPQIIGERWESCYDLYEQIESQNG